jgi:RHS repeat-associated protein
MGRKLSRPCAPDQANSCSLDRCGTAQDDPSNSCTPRRFCGGRFPRHRLFAARCKGRCVLRTAADVREAANVALCLLMSLLYYSLRLIRHWARSKVRSGMYYYGYRFYDPNLQRWPNRDPIGEKDGINFYAMVRNNPIMLVDALGLLAGELCVRSNCKGQDLSRFTYLAEKEPPCEEDRAAGQDEGRKKPRFLPNPGECVDADAVYFPGGAIKIGDLGAVDIDCSSVLKGHHFPFWGDGARWNYGVPTPPVPWPDPNIPPYKIDPPGDPLPPLDPFPRAPDPRGNNSL